MTDPFGNERDAAEVRAEFDSELGVSQWRHSRDATARAAPVDDGAPSWWYGDEEASQSFLREMRPDLRG